MAVATINLRIRKELRSSVVWGLELGTSDERPHSPSMPGGSLVRRSLHLRPTLTLGLTWGLSTRTEHVLCNSAKAKHRVGSSEQPTGGLKGHLPSLAFLVDFADILLREAVLLRDLEGNGRISLPVA